MNPMTVSVEAPGSRVIPDGAVVVKIAGEIGITSMIGEDGKHSGIAEDNVLSNALKSVLASQPTLVVVDLSQASYLSSFGMGALLRFANHLQESGGKLKLAGVTPMVLTLLTRCRLDRVFDIAPNVDAALAAPPTPNV